MVRTIYQKEYQNQVVVSHRKRQTKSVKTKIKTKK